MVAGGAAESFAERATEILDLDSLQWRQGPPLPESVSPGLSVPHRDAFLIFGRKDEIYELVEEIWVLREEKLRRREQNFGPFLLRVPNDWC